MNTNIHQIIDGTLRVDDLNLDGESMIEIRAQIDKLRFEAEDFAERCKGVAELFNEKIVAYMLETGQESDERDGVKIALRRETVFLPKNGARPEDILDVMRELEIKDAEKITFKDSAIPEIVETLKAANKAGLWNASPNQSALRKYVRTRLDRAKQLPVKLAELIDADIYTTVRSSKASTVYETKQQ